MISVSGYFYTSKFGEVWFRFRKFGVVGLLYIGGSHIKVHKPKRFMFSHLGMGFGIWVIAG